MPSHALPPGPEARARRQAARRRKLRRFPRNVLIGMGVILLVLAVRTLLHLV
jgi:hypothetical protein